MRQRSWREQGRETDLLYRDTSWGLLRDSGFQNTWNSLKETTWFCLALPYRAVPLLAGGTIRSEARSVLAAKGSPA